MINFTTEDIINLEKKETETQFNDYLQKKGSKSSSILMLIRNCYFYATCNQFTIEQKQEILNTILSLVYQIPNLKTSKAQFPYLAKEQILGLASRSQSNLAPNFSRSQAEGIFQFFENQVSPYYELYQLILDSNPEFSLKCKEFQPIFLSQQKKIYQGEVVEVQTISILKDLVGERIPKQEKKEGKKK